MSLDIPERQLLAYYEDDDVPWHHRVLLVKVHGSTYILATPDLEIQVQDVAALTVRPVARNSAFPAVGGAVYSFDRDLTEERLANLRAEARMLGEIMGADLAVPGVAAGPEAAWLIADPANEAFGKPVPAAVHTSPDRFVVRGSMALAKIDDEWTFAEHVGVADKAEWMEDKRSGAGRDPRLGPSARLADGSPAGLLKDQLPELKKAKITLVGDPFEGAPPALAELLSGIVASGNECVPYHQHWVRISGVSPHAGIAIEHGVLFTILTLMICFDLLNVLNLASAEQTARRILMIERAVKRSAKSPDFEGLDVLLSNQFDSTGGVLTRVFDKYISEIQKNDAVVLKQQRLYREETEADTKRKGKHGPRGKEGEGP
jgi:hypothetical protein